MLTPMLYLQRLEENGTCESVLSSGATFFAESFSLASVIVPDGSHFFFRLTFSVITLDTVFVAELAR